MTRTPVPTANPTTNHLCRHPAHLCQHLAHRPCRSPRTPPSTPSASTHSPTAAAKSTATSTQHHITYWQNGGATDLNNLALLCSECHQQIHNTTWELHMGEDGHPYSIPPAETDPDQQPIPSYHRRRKPRRQDHSA
ncbi:HNH endonuclease signature motif containing protein [Rhodococcus sp. KRD197]|uniref:HNH endonuclease signature motif containing protein n=1 Tax=Rhodococcus sp. KRD197 TaxID=2729731 RepID=UPI0034D73364